MSGSIIVLNGPAGVGKTTVSRYLAARLPGSVLIPGDVLRRFAPDDARQYLGPGSTCRAAASLAGAYLRMGAEYVVFEYVIETGEQLNRFLEEVEARAHVFTLWAPLAVVVDRESRRADRSAPEGRVQACHAFLERHRHELGTVIDAADRTPDEVAELIQTTVETVNGHRSR